MEEVFNYMEKWVAECLDKFLKDSKGCKCDKCRKDMFALALNNLKPYYVATERGRVMAKLANTENQFETDIIIQVTKAIHIVQENPHHN